MKLKGYNAGMNRFGTLADLIDIRRALDADRSTPLARRKERDRRIGAALQDHKAAPARQLRGWLELVDLPAWKRNGQRGAQLYRWIGASLALAGLVGGWGVASAVLHYTGDAPINVINALAVLILPQVVLLLFWLLAMVPVRLPLLGGLRASLRLLNPGRMARFAVQRFGNAGGRGLEMVWEPDNAIVLAPAARWLFSLWSQLFAFAFNVGALLAMLYLVSFSDLAFGWSTTLNLDAGSFQRFVQGMAVPWQHWIPQAVPSASLVEASRYFRLETGAIAIEQAVLLGSWWPFLAASLICYGLLPRLLTLLISWQRFRHHLSTAMPRLPGAPELLARMNSPLVRTAAARPEAVAEVDPDAARSLEHAPVKRTRCTLVAWSGSVDARNEIQQALSELGIEPQGLLHAGGTHSTTDDETTVEALCRQRDLGVAIIAKAWEPPLLDFLDFLQSVRKRCARGQPVIVLLWGAEVGVTASDAEVWNLTLRQLSDPNLHIEVLP